MAYYEVFLYTFWNCAGYLFFQFVWNKLPKPKPVDYTTIPGMKLDCTAEELPELSIKPGVPLTKVDSTLEGHMNDLIKLGSVEKVLNYLFTMYGPLSSFYWGPRYVVVVSSHQLLTDLRASTNCILTANPLAFGSVLLGDPRYVTHLTLKEVFIAQQKMEVNNENLLFTKQHEIFMRGPLHNENDEEPFPTNNPDYVNIKDTLYSLSEVHTTIKSEMENGRKISEVLKRPLVIMFNDEIDIDAHPVPAWVPIIIDCAKIYEECDDDFLEKYCKDLDFVPGFSKLLQINDE